MPGRVKILKYQSGWFWDSMKIEALDNCSVDADNMLASVTFYLNKGDTLVVRAAKSWMFEKGDEAGFEDVISNFNSGQFPWRNRY